MLSKTNKSIVSCVAALLLSILSTNTLAMCSASIIQELDFGTYIKNQPNRKRAIQPALISLECTTLQSLNVLMGFGEDPDTLSTPNVRRMQFGGHHLRYQIYVEGTEIVPGSLPVWGTNNSLSESTVMKTLLPDIPSLLRIDNAYIFGNQAPPTGLNYTDMITISLEL